MKRLTLRVDDRLAEKIKKVAKEKRCSTNQFILSLLWKETKNFDSLK